MHFRPHVCGTEKRQEVTHLSAELSKQTAKRRLEDDTHTSEAPTLERPDEVQRHECELVDDPGPEEEPDGYGHGV